MINALVLFLVTETKTRTKKARMNLVADVHKTYLIPKYPSQSGRKCLNIWI